MDCRGFAVWEKRPRGASDDHVRSNFVYIGLVADYSLITKKWDQKWGKKKTR